MSKVLAAAKRLTANYNPCKEHGATLAEYGLLLALIAAVCVAAISLLGSQISSFFSTLSGTI